MRFSATALIGTLAGLASLSVGAPLEKRVSGTPGFDISGYQPNPNYSSAVANGAKFVIIKATEGTTFKSSSFSSQYTGATNAGLIRGAYHFAHPDSSSGATQAKFFLANCPGVEMDGDKDGIPCEQQHCH